MKRVSYARSCDTKRDGYPRTVIPLPERHGALVATLVPHLLFELEGVPTMPEQELSVEVDLVRRVSLLIGTPKVS